MSEWDIGSVSFTSAPAQNQNAVQDNYLTATKRFYSFLREYIVDSVYVYRNQMRSNLLVPEYSLTVDLRHIQIKEPELAAELTEKPNEFLPLLEKAAQQLAKNIHYEEEMELNDIPEIQVILKSNDNILQIRDVSVKYITKMVRVFGIVSSSSTPTARVTRLHLYCRGCRHEKIMQVEKGFVGVQIPRTCENPSPAADKQCPLDPYIVDHDKSQYVDQQSLKLQEAPENVPVGEMPRHILMTVDRYLTNRIVPGTRVSVVGVFDVFRKGQKGKNDAAVQHPYIRVVGMELDINATSREKRYFSAEEEAQYIEIAKNPDIYNVFSQSIAPSIFGNTDIKKSVACLLMGGSKKILADGARLRGDIHVLLLGDPGTAKSQLLKFVHKVAPIAVYTSGQGSSAAGLTASVIRDPSSRDFYLEAGAMVLSDGGVVCIDEFDKMREEDRVAIHEAMEQQTISIAKAGITTVLNSRTSVLAAANPVYGRYDDMKTPGENIDFQSTILSRFDMIYILKDEHQEARDETLAKFVLNVHEKQSNDTVEGEMDMKTMKGFISYCRAKCAPRLSPEAAEKLSSHFVEIRAQVQRYETESNTRSSVPITIRQLEAIIRISESIAKMSLSPVVKEQHVDEALRLFRVSTFAATQSGYVVGEGVLMGEFKKEIMKAQDLILKRISMGQTIKTAVIRDYLRKMDFTEYAIERSMKFLLQSRILQASHQGQQLQRLA